MSSIISSVLHFCRRSANAINVTSVSKTSWSFPHIFFDTPSKCFVVASKLYSEKGHSSKEDDKPNISDKNSSNSNGDSNKDSSEGLQDTFFTKDPAFGNKDNKGLAAGPRPFYNPEDSEENLIVDYELQAPTNCCMSGCPNCVWLEYVEKLTAIYSNPELSREKILKELDKMEDQNIKAFIMMELRTRKLI